MYPWLYPTLVNLQRGTLLKRNLETLPIDATFATWFIELGPAKQTTDYSTAKPNVVNQSQLFRCPRNLHWASPFTTHVRFCADDGCVMLTSPELHGDVKVHRKPRCTEGVTLRLGR